MEEIIFDQFQALDIRIGTVVNAEVPEWSHWVMKLTVDFGTEIGERTIFAGIMKHYKPEEVKGRQAPFIINLKYKKIGPEGDFSQGMMLMASVTKPQASLMASIPSKTDNPEEETPIFLNLDKKVPNGTKVR